MTQQASFTLRNRNPDVLTCIANLSNDEVFTPPELANQILDMLTEAWAKDKNGENIWENKDVKFLDPCTKSGVFLREIASRLTKGLEKKIPILEKRVDHILSNQIYGIGITKLTSLLARRSVYCSKNADGEHSIAKSLKSKDGNIWYKRLEHTWNDEKCVYCGANKRDYDRGPESETHAYSFIHSRDIRNDIKEFFGASMQFDVIIGNPPYQLGQSGGEAVGGFAMPIYQKFIQSATSLDPRYVVMVTPSRWFAGGRSLEDFRKEMLTDRRLRKLVDFPDASEAFPGTQIKGGVSYFLWDSSWAGQCEVTTIEKGRQTSPSLQRNLADYDIFVRRNEAIPILNKVLEFSKKNKFSNLAAKVSPIQPFSLRTNFKGSDSKVGLKNPVRVIGNGGDTYIDRPTIPRNDDWIDDWKVLLGRAYGAGDTYPHQIYNYPIVAEPGTACTETYLVINRFNDEIQSRRFALYLQTRFVRFLVSLRKMTQDIYNERFQFVPDLAMDQDWTDEKLYKMFDISVHEINFIDSMIRPMERNND